MSSPNCIQSIVFTFFLSVLSRNPLEIVILIMKITLLVLRHIWNLLEFAWEKKLHLGYNAVIIHNFLFLFLEQLAKSILNSLSWENFSPSSFKDSLDFKDNL